MCNIKAQYRYSIPNQQIFFFLNVKIRTVSKMCIPFVFGQNLTKLQRQLEITASNIARNTIKLSKL